MTDDDKSRLIGEIAARCKIRLDADDPVFAVVELNRLVLDEVVRDMLQRVQGLLSGLPRAATEPPLVKEPTNQTSDHLAEKLDPLRNKPAKIKVSPSGGWAQIMGWATTLVLGALAIGYLLGGAQVRLP